MERKLLEFLLESSNLAAYVLNKEYKIEYMNKTAKEFSPNANVGNLFFRDLCGRENACHNCPSAELFNKRNAISRRSVNSVLSEDNDNVFYSNCKENLCGFADVRFVSITNDNESDLLVLWSAFDKGEASEKTDTEKQHEDEVSVQSDKSGFNIPGINIKEGTDKFGGNFEAYIDVLKVYYEVGNDKAGQIMQLYKDGDFANLRIEIHGLKGTSYAIGANELGDFAKKLEYACRDYLELNDEKAHEVIDSEINRLLEEYATLLICLSEYFAEESLNEENTGNVSDQAASLDAMPDEDILSSLNVVYDYIDDFELDEAMEILNSLIPDKSGKYGDIISKIKQAINQCQYDLAKELIEKG